MFKLLTVSLVVLILNIPFGYWRAHVKRFSLQWFLAIHIPVLLVISLRLATHLGFKWPTYVALIMAFFLGQQLGSLIIKGLAKKCTEISSCLVMDLARCIRTVH